MNAKELSVALGNVQTYYIHEAASYQSRKSNRTWLKCSVVAACFCLVVLGGLLAFRFFDKKDQEIRLSTNNISDLSAMYDGVILTDKLPLSDAVDSSVTLCYTGTNDDYASAEWNTLSVSANYDHYAMVMTCSFHKPMEQAEILDTLTYGDIEVSLSHIEATPEYPYHIAAHFEYAGVYYILATHSVEPDCIYSLLETVIGDLSQSAENKSFTNILGYNGYRIQVEESIPGLFLWHYLTEIDGKEVCIGEMCGYLTPGAEPDAYSVDLDGDGITELICNETAGTGAQFVTVYRNRNGNIEEGRILQNYLAEEHGLSIGEIGSICERYDPEKNIFVITGTSTDGISQTVLLEGLESFEFLPYHSDESIREQYLHP